MPKTFYFSYLRLIQSPESMTALAPFWRLPFSKPSWWGADKGSFLGLILGALSPWIPRLKNPLSKGKYLMEWLLTKVFARFIPLFILGFMSQLYATGLLGYTLRNYGVLIFWLILIIGLYILLWLFSYLLTERHGV